MPRRSRQTEFSSWSNQTAQRAFPVLALPIEQAAVSHDPFAKSSHGKSSFITKCNHRIDLRSPSRGQPGSEQSHENEKNGYTEKCGRVGRFHLVKHIGHQARQPQGACHAKHKPDPDQSHSLSQHEAEHVTSRGTKRYADADFARA